MNDREGKLVAFGRLLDIMDELREKCPWDRVQTNESLRANTIEETYELCDALIKDDNDEIKKELGDLLLHIVFYSKIGEEKKVFDVSDVCNSICDKLIFRHPHVFGELSLDSSEMVEKSWEKLKIKERGADKSVLDGVPSSLPSMIKAYRIQDKARNVGFDWEKKEDVWSKVEEELSELKNEIAVMDSDKMEAELGDFIFSVINASRLYNINPDNALERTNLKFISRFNYIEKRTKEMGKALSDLSLEEMDDLWKEAKLHE